jgi:hypothetical protein
MIVKAYIDEAGTHGSAPHMTMGALVGRINQWVHFNREWEKMLRQNGIEYFHTKKWKDSDGPFKGWNRANKAALIVRASDILRDTTSFGVSVKVRQQDYEENYKLGERPKKIPLDTMYGLCFRYLADFITNMAARTFEGEDVENSFILESGHKNAGDAIRIFNQLKNGADNPGIFRSIIFEGKKNQYGVQGADLVSHTTFLAEREDESELDLTEFPEGGNLADAQNLLKRNGPIFRGVLSPEALRMIKASKLAWEKERIEFGRRKSLPSANPA